MEPTTIGATRLRLETRDLLERVKFNGERFVVKTFGRPMAVIISLEDFQCVEDTLNSEKLQAPRSALKTAATEVTHPERRSRVKTKS